MKEPTLDSRTLDRECAVFCRYLIGEEPNDYVKGKYREAHRSPSWARSGHSDPSDHFLVKFARMSPRSTKVIDAYARVFRPAMLVRKKLVLLLAILESCAPTHAYLDAVDSRSLFLLSLRSLRACFTFALMVVVAVVLILPLELAVRGGVKFFVSWVPHNG